VVFRSHKWQINRSSYHDILNIEGEINKHVVNQSCAIWSISI